ncbi:MAG: class I SAM-dependent methyltransferase, partial [Bacteroidota bacterium]
FFPIFAPMALAQHASIDLRWQQQVENARTYVLPFIEKGITIGADTRVMEIGCGEGGVLVPFVEKGAFCMGVDLSPSRIEHARRLQSEQIAQGKAHFVTQNVYDADFLAEHKGSFDLIMLKDTIEHIPDQEKFIPYLKEFLVPGGLIFFGFPPWYMPFGGHQQICSSKLLGYLPYYHLLPTFLYRGILNLAKEHKGTVKELMDIKSTGISLHRFERIIRQSGLSIVHHTLFFINPIYRYKFGLKPRKQLNIIRAIPVFRDFVSTAGWYLVGREK